MIVIRDILLIEYFPRFGCVMKEGLDGGGGGGGLVFTIH